MKKCNPLNISQISVPSLNGDKNGVPFSPGNFFPLWATPGARGCNVACQDTKKTSKWHLQSLNIWSQEPLRCKPDLPTGLRISKNHWCSLIFSWFCEHVRCVLCIRRSHNGVSQDRVWNRLNQMFFYENGSYIACIRILYGYQ